VSPRGCHKDAIARKDYLYAGDFKQTPHHSHPAERPQMAHAPRRAFGAAFIRPFSCALTGLPRSRSPTDARRRRLLALEGIGIRLDVQFVFAFGLLSQF
jgi:hypothetical protein